MSNLVRGVTSGVVRPIVRAIDGPLVGSAGVPVPIYAPTITPIHTFSSGWFHGGTATASTMAATDSEVGTHSAITTGTSGTGAFSIYNQAAVNMTDRHLVVRVKIDDFSKVGGIFLRVSDDVNVATRYTDLRMTGGNSVNSIYSLGDGWVDVTFSWADSTTTGTVNRAAIKSWQFRILAFGGAGTTVRLKSLGRIDARGPFGVVSFDDNRKSAELGLPKMQALGIPPVMYTIVGLIGATDHQTLSDLVAWETTYGGEVAAHCFYTATHDAPNGYASLSEADIRNDMRQLRAYLLGSNPMGHRFRGYDHFAWPKGQFNPTAEAVAKEFFSTATMATPAYIAQAWPTANPGRIARVPVTASTTPAQIQAEAAKAVANKTGVEFMFHRLVASGATGDTEYNIADFEAAMDLVAATGLPMLTKSQVIAAAYA